MRIEGNSYVGEGEVRLHFLPRAHIHLYGYFPGVSVREIDIGRKEISSFSINSHQIEGFRLSREREATTQLYNIKWCPKSEPVIGVGDDSTQIVRVVFHLFNFVYMLGTRRTTEQSRTREVPIEHVDLACDEWKVELKSLPSTLEDIKRLEQEGGYGLAHIGKIQKADETSFTGKDVEGCLVALQFFLSFAKGSWCRPGCAVGFDISGNRVWESWSLPGDPWQYTLS